MSKAFTSSQDDQEDTELEAEAPTEADGVKNYITPRGAERLKDELRRLLHEDRPALVQTVSWAASNGDRSENGDYIYGKRRLREIDRRIRFLTKRLEAAVIVDPATQSGDRVLFGATVTVADEEGRERTFQIVGIDEADVRNGKVSWISPIAKCLLNAKSGDTVMFRRPKVSGGPGAEEELEIVEVHYGKV